MSGILRIILGLVLVIVGLVAGVSWLIFCFGSVIAVVLILIFNPALLFLPFLISGIGLAQMKSGWTRLSSAGGSRSDYHPIYMSAALSDQLKELDLLDDDLLTGRSSVSEEKPKTDFEKMMEAHDREMDEVLGRAAKRPDDVPF